jgi:hypothetical protein
VGARRRPCVGRRVFLRRAMSDYSAQMRARRTTGTGLYSAGLALTVATMVGSIAGWRAGQALLIPAGACLVGGAALERGQVDIPPVERPSGLPVCARLLAVGLIGLAWVAQGVVTLLG